MIAASAGGVEAIQRLLAAVPTASGGSIFVVLHIGDCQTGNLPAVLGQRTSTPCSHPADGTRIQPGHIYVAPGGYHMLLQDDRIRLNRGPKVNWTRPAADPLFFSAAEAYGPDVVGIVLTGYQHDGADGMARIKAKGGLTLVQDPKEAFAPSMPRAALARDSPEVLRISQIAERLTVFCAARRIRPGLL